MRKTTFAIAILVIVAAVISGFYAVKSMRNQKESETPIDQSTGGLIATSTDTTVTSTTNPTLTGSTKPNSPVKIVPTTTKPMPSSTSPVAPVTPPASTGTQVNITLGDSSTYYKSGGKDPKDGSDDLREFQHGINFLPLSNGNYYIVYSSSGNPPTGSNGENWTHDVYYSVIDPKNPRIKPVLLISKPEAQEPLSAAINSNGKILVTMEDGWNTDEEVDQRYALYDSNFGVIKPYPQQILEGNHSGHVAAVGDKFVVFQSEGWVDGGGIDNLGSGDDVLAFVIDSNGTIGKRVEVAYSQKTRDWWPVIAASPSNAALVWQRFVNGQQSADLYFSILDPNTGTLTKTATKIASGVKYYTFNVNYVSAIDRFVIMGTYYSGGGFGYLVDRDGNITASNTSLPAIVRESQSIAKGTTAVQVLAPTGVGMYDLTKDSISLRKKISDSHEWQYIGTDGLFVDSDTVYIVSLSSRGLIEKIFNF